MTGIRVRFAPSGINAEVEAGTTVAEAARAAGLLLAAPCAGRGVCGGCGVRVVAGELAEPDEIERTALARAREGVRLACRARVIAPVEVRPLFVTEGAATVAHAAQAADGPGPRAVRTLVAGVDLGTTSVAGLVADAATGAQLARASVPNRQAAFGADVLSRLSAARSGAAEELATLAAASVRESLESAVAQVDAAISDLGRVVIAGNSAMAALLERADTTSLEAFPFDAPVKGGALGTAAREAIGLAAGCEALLVAPIAAFVGGDALAASVAAGLVDVERPTLLVDIGTNAELVLARPEGALVTSAAAGPAFEGGGVTSGGPPLVGAVTGVRIAPSTAEVSLATIGSAAATWFTGAGLLSAVSALRGNGSLGADGLLAPDGSLAARLSRDAAGVLGVDLGEEGRPLVLTQLDVRALQLAKAALRVAIGALLTAADVRADELDRVLVAGAFGAALDPDDLVALGVLPANAAGKIERIGNAALDGATAIALDPALTALAERFAADARHIDLALADSFGAAFVAATEFAPYEI